MKIKNNDARELVPYVLLLIDAFDNFNLSLKEHSMTKVVNYEYEVITNILIILGYEQSRNDTTINNVKVNARNGLLALTLFRNQEYKKEHEKLKNRISNILENHGSEIESYIKIRNRFIHEPHGIMIESITSMGDIPKSRSYDLYKKGKFDQTVSINFSITTIMLNEILLIISDLSKLYSISGLGMHDEDVNLKMLIEKFDQYKSKQ
jgi:hypothetical protein